MSTERKVGELLGISPELVKEALTAAPDDLLYLFFELPTVAACRAKWNRVTSESTRAQTILERWIELAKTMDELKEPLREATRSSRGTKAEKEGLKKLYDFSMEMVRAADTRAKIKKAYEGAPFMSPAKEIALEKLIRFSETIEEVCEALSCASFGSEAERLALEKWDNLSTIEVGAAATPEDLQRAHRRARKHSEPRRLAIRRAAEMLDA